jgi:hypothetical protein
MVAEVCLGKVGAVAAREVSRFARNSREWQQLVEVCRVVDTVLIDQEMVYAPRLSNDRLLLGLKGSLNEYELDLLQQRSVEARREKARRGELLQAAPVGYVKTEDQRLEKDPDLRVQQAILLVFRKFMELGTVRQTLMWFLEPERLFGSGRFIATTALVPASRNATLTIRGSFDNPSCASPSHNAAVNRAVVDRVSQVCFGAHDTRAMSLMRRTWPASITDLQKERRFSSSQAAGELTQLVDAFLSCRTSGVSWSMT